MTPYFYVDVHTHLTHEQFTDDLGEVIARAENAGLGAIVVNGLEPVSNRAILQMASTLLTVSMPCCPQIFRFKLKVFLSKMKSILSGPVPNKGSSQRSVNVASTVIGVTKALLQHKRRFLRLFSTLPTLPTFPRSSTPAVWNKGPLRS